jgi:hypothetical protein
VTPTIAAGPSLATSALPVLGRAVIVSTVRVGVPTQRRRGGGVTILPNHVLFGAVLPVAFLLPLLDGGDFLSGFFQDFLQSFFFPFFLHLLLPSDLLELPSELSLELSSKMSGTSERLGKLWSSGGIWAAFF